MSCPERTCIGCRGRDEKSKLVRLVWSTSSVAVDPGQTAPGRGAYLHRKQECVELAVRRRVIGRALGVSNAEANQVLHLLADSGQIPNLHWVGA